jgi:hypothetical protein
VSKFHSILRLIAQESWLRKKGLVLSKNYAQFWVDRTSLSQFPDKSGTIWGGLVRIGFFSPRIIHYFCHILLIGCLIDPVLFLLHSYLQGDHFYIIGWCVYHLIIGFWFGFEFGT